MLSRQTIVVALLTFVLAVLIFGTARAAFEGDRAALISAFRAVIVAEARSAGNDATKWRVEDTGEDMDLGEGDGPVVKVTIPNRHFCIVALHPTEPASALLGCAQIPEEERRLDRW